MDFLSQYSIPFSSLKQGLHEFEFQLGALFLEHYGLDELSNVDVKAEVEMEKQSSMLVLNFSLNGSCDACCDRCATQLSFPISHKERLIMKFGDVNYEETEELIVIPSEDHQINVAHYLYEFLTLAIPARKVHNDGECDPEVVARLDSKNQLEEQSDSPWEKLTELKFNEN